MANFVYPFNFVPPALRKPRPNDPMGIGEYRSYQQLHQYNGKSGRIEFTLTNLSPLFIPDPEGTSYYHVTDGNGNPRDDENGHPLLHRVLDFFNVNGRLAIPSTSLKGMVRSISEALSNSSFGVFTPERKKITFRKTNDLGTDQLRNRKWGEWRGDGTIEELKVFKIWRQQFDAAFNLTSEPLREAHYKHLREYRNRTWVDVEVWQLHTGNQNVRHFSDGTHSGAVFSNITTAGRTGVLMLREQRKTQIVQSIGSAISGPLFRAVNQALNLRGTGPWLNVEFEIARISGQGEQIYTLRYRGRQWRNNRTIAPHDLVRRGTGLLMLTGHNTQLIPTNGPPIKGPHLGTVRGLRGAIFSGNGPWFSVQFETVSGVPNAKTNTAEERICALTYHGRRWSANQGSKRAFLWPRKNYQDIEPAPRTGLREGIHYIAALHRTGQFLTVDERAIQEYMCANDSSRPNAGDIVRYRTDNNRVVEFGPAAMFKTAEQATVHDIARQTHQILPCERNSQLCPASRLFGWTPEGDRQQGDEKSPVAGRVRLSVAWSDKTLNDTRLIPLQILGSPKPQYYPFYLRPEEEAQNPIQDLASTQPAYYATPQQVGGWWHKAGLLRGRKFYVHHPDAVFDPQATARASRGPADPDVACERVEITSDMVKGPQDLRSHQNTTAAVLPPGAEFKGYIEFDSLSHYELGLLLWAISLADSPLEGSTERAHKLGMGRPIGMGSVRLRIDRIVECDPVGGWRDADDPEEQEIDHEEAKQLVKAFKTWMVTGEETPDDAQVTTFDNQRFYQDLCAVLSLNLAGNDPVQYYPPDDASLPQDKKVPAYEGYRYFVEQRKKRNQATEEPLRTPRALRNGDRQTWP